MVNGDSRDQAECPSWNSDRSGWTVGDFFVGWTAGFYGGICIFWFLSMKLSKLSFFLVKTQVFRVFFASIIFYCGKNLSPHVRSVKFGAICSSHPLQTCATTDSKRENYWEENDSLLDRGCLMLYFSQTTSHQVLQHGLISYRFIVLCFFRLEKEWLNELRQIIATWFFISDGTGNCKDEGRGGLKFWNSEVEK